MKKFFTILFLILSSLYAEKVFAKSYYFKDCKLSNVATGDYIINLDKKVIEVTLKAADGRVQKFSDKIKIIEKNRVITEKIESGIGDQIYFEYHLNLKTEKIIKLQYKKESCPDMDIFKIQEKKASKCSNVKGGWDTTKIEKAALNKEQERIAKAQKKLKRNRVL